MQKQLIKVQNLFQLLEPRYGNQVSFNRTTKYSLLFQNKSKAVDARQVPLSSL